MLGTALCMLTGGHDFERVGVWLVCTNCGKRVNVESTKKDDEP